MPANSDTSPSVPRLWFRKKPVVIKALQWTGENRLSVEAFVGRELFMPGPAQNPTRGLVIPTLEGEHLASPGDWIIRGIKGEFYPCKPDIFGQTYEPAESPDD